MRTFFLILVSFFIISACSKSDDSNNNNAFLPNIAFDTGNLINTNFPQYNNLLFAGNYIVLNKPYGINGTVLFYAGGTNYSAFELSDPNHRLSTCSSLTVNGIIASCDCDDDNAYDILIGLGQEGTTGQYALKRYFVEVNDNIIRVFNN